MHRARARDAGLVLALDDARDERDRAAASHDPHFRVADSIHEACGLANTGHPDIAEGTAVCRKTCALNDKRVRITGSPAEVDHARERLVGQGVDVDVDRIVTAYADAPAYVEVVENTLGNRRQ